MFLNYTRATLGPVDGIASDMDHLPYCDLAQPRLLMVHKSPVGPQHILRPHNNNGIKYLYFIARPPREISNAMIGFWETKNEEN